ncbi:hypothetical protein BB560_001577 [Smittium megazygosporum]|uniref:Peroxin domain-containing protein n=1 Tax=Smittium megazygosporum TaxID=133381 RepID=A0A2T9ZH52_9FUNG|nr:hypothetical protein BB560_001577 [Smittium megazygosporum]
MSFASTSDSTYFLDPSSFDASINYSSDIESEDPDQNCLKINTFISHTNLQKLESFYKDALKQHNSNSKAKLLATKFPKNQIEVYILENGQPGKVVDNEEFSDKISNQEMQMYLTLIRRYNATKSIRKNYSKLNSKPKTCKQAPKGRTFSEDETCDSSELVYELLKFLDKNANHKIDYSYESSDRYRESYNFSEISRIMKNSTPYQNFMMWLFDIIRWNNPILSLSVTLMYFNAVYRDKIIFLLTLLPIYVIMFYKVNYIKAESILCFDKPRKLSFTNNFFKKLSTGVVGKTKSAIDLYEFIDKSIPPDMGIVLEDYANILEMVKNCVTWKDPNATNFVLCILVFCSIATLIFPPALLYKSALYIIGIELFVLAPLRTRFPAYRRLFSFLEYLFWNSQNDLDVAIDIFNNEISQTEGRDHTDIDYFDDPSTPSIRSIQSNMSDLYFLKTQIKKKKKFKAAPRSEKSNLEINKESSKKLTSISKNFSKKMYSRFKNSVSNTKSELKNSASLIDINSFSNLHN